MADRYPAARRLDLIEHLHGYDIADPYRWLEDGASPETEAWSQKQDTLVRTVLDGLPGREQLRTRLFELLPGMIGLPAFEGGRGFYYRRLPNEDHITYVVREPDGTERVLIDPARLSEEHTITLDAAVPSHDGRRVAYHLSEGGDELSTLHVMDVDSRDDIDDPVVVGRTGAVRWLPDGEQFFYVRRLPDLPPEEQQFHRRVWRRRIGTPITDDELIFGDGRDKTTYYDIHVSRGGRWLVVSGSLGTAPRNDVYLRDLHGDEGFTAIQEGVDAIVHASVRRDGRMYVMTNRDAHRWRVAVADPHKPAPELWTDLLAEDPEAVLTDFAVTDDAVIAVRTRDVVSEVTVHDKETGVARAKVGLPGLGIANVRARPEGGDDVWISYTDYVTPTRILHHAVATGATEAWADAPGGVAAEGVVATQVFYPSRDGTRIPMFVLHREGVEPNGDRPTILYGYGGFNISLAPSYSTNALAWVEQGGVYAVANLRGGDEYGEEWHRAGMRGAKQNVFDDFICAAEWLIDSGWTSRRRLAISGGSNGGLLVGAALTQRPDLFRAVLCSAPLLDMVRYERFGLGVTWNDEYGTVDDPEELGWLIGYSPYHRVVAGTDYPAVLFTVFESDTRVDPLHARKMCAALQHGTTADPDDKPVLLRRETKVGHGQRSVARTVDLAVDTLSFLAWQLNLRQ